MRDEERWKDYFSHDRFAGLTGVELREVRPGYAASRMEITERHLNALDITQGGAIFTLADFTFAAVSNSYGKAAVAIHAAITFHRPASGGVLTAEAREISRTRTTASYEVAVTDDKQKRVATFSGLAFIQDRDIP